MLSPTAQRADVSRKSIDGSIISRETRAGTGANQTMLCVQAEGRGGRNWAGRAVWASDARGNKQTGGAVMARNPRFVSTFPQALSSLPSRCYYLLKIPQALELRGVDDRQG